VAEKWPEFSGGLRGRRTRAPETPPFSCSGGVLVLANDSRSARHWSARTYHITKKRFPTYEAAKAAEAYARDVQCIGVPSAPPLQEAGLFLDDGV
jgi:hypothetical protein